MSFDPSKGPIRAVLAYCVLSNDSSEKKKYQLAESMLKHEFGVDYPASKLKLVSFSLHFYIFGTGYPQYLTGKRLLASIHPSIRPTHPSIYPSYASIHLFICPNSLGIIF